MKQEFKYLLTAISFYTCIPVGSIPRFTDSYINKSLKYLPLVGILVGGLSGLIFFLVTLIFPITVSLVISMAVQVLITGAFHEDGLADFFDGFGGGYTKERILEIMKDSRIGNYGAISLIISFLLKFSILLSMPIKTIPLILIIGNSCSRFWPVLIVRSLNYSREDSSSKVKPLAKSIDNQELTIAAIFSFLPFIFFSYQTLLIIPFLFMFWAFFRKYLQRKIGGYTGDCLGALQQISEIILYLLLLIIMKIPSSF